MLVLLTDHQIASLISKSVNSLIGLHAFCKIILTLQFKLLSRQLYIGFDLLALLLVLPYEALDNGLDASPRNIVYLGYSAIKPCLFSLETSLV